jgi:hypothetical protein
LNQFGSKSLLEIPSLFNELLSSPNSKEYLLSVIKTVQLIRDPSCRTKVLKSLGAFANSIQPPSKVLTHHFGLLAFLACQTELEANVILGALQRFGSSRGDSGSQWKDGLKFMEICRLLILNHPDSVDAIVEVVEELGTTWDSIDIQERAELLIRTVRVLSEDVEERKRFLTPPTVCESLSTESSVVEETVDSFVDNEEANSMLAFKQNLDLRKNICRVLDHGWALFHDNSIILPFTIRFSVPCETDPDACFSIELSFSVSGNHEPFHVVTIPYLAQPREGDPVVRFPFKYDVELVLRPINPVPATFSVYAVYTDKDGKSHRSELEPFRVSLEDMFMPTNYNDRAELVSLWESKWTEDRAFAKLLSIEREKLRELISARLGPFLIPQEIIKDLNQVPAFDFNHELLLHGDTETVADVEERAVLIHLPPDYHLMLRFVMGKYTCVVWIATDRCDVLSLLDSFFHSWSMD